jgi:hypothetical protein
VGNSTPVAVVCPLPAANFVQAFVAPGETDQVFTVTLVDGTTVAVPSGGGWELDADMLIASGDTAFELQTADSTVNFQIVWMLKKGSV